MYSVREWYLLCNKMQANSISIESKLLTNSKYGAHTPLKLVIHERLRPSCSVSACCSLWFIMSRALTQKQRLTFPGPKHALDRVALITHPDNLADIRISSLAGFCHLAWVFWLGWHQHPSHPRSSLRHLFAEDYRKSAVSFSVFRAGFNYSNILRMSFLPRGEVTSCDV